ncbi:hypothetical protein FPRO05_14150 [Fusarium proliferatum]|uniref:Piwi domain-containing protein n=1 Tax=Gibberella intermedia TaxID=948311 RepID=A0A365MTJ1_GIBIN|nr:hypothetical protein FPRO05_14150 [Fusarium proliferatum]
MSSGNRDGGDHGGRGRGGGRGGRGSYGPRGGSGSFRGDRGGSRGAGGGRGGYGRPPGGGQQTIQIFPNSQGQNSQVAKVEDALYLATKNKLDLDSLKLTERFPSRPGYGTRGTKVELTANYVELLPPSNLTLHRYDIQISPVAVGKKHFRIVQLLLQAPEFAAQQGDIATDFRSTLVSKTKFSQDEVLIEVPYRSEGEDEPTARATIYKVRVQYTKTLNVGELVNYLNSTSLSQSLVDKQELTQALNIFLNHYAKSAKNLVTIGSTKSFSLGSDAARGDIGSGLEIIRGFFSSVRVATCRILVNINTTHLSEKRNKANEVIPRVKTIFGLARKDDGHGLAHPPRVRQHGAGAKDVEFWLDGEASSSGAPKPVAKGGAKGKGKGKGKAQVESSAASTSGRYITVFDFFRISALFSFSITPYSITDCDAAYNRALQDPQLPLVNCGTRNNPMYLPAEVCVVLPGQPSKSKLNSSQAQQMIRHAVRKPWENANSIYSEGVKTVGLDENTNVLLRSFGLKITLGLIKVPGRVLVGPKVIYKGNKTAGPRFGSWNMMDIKFNIGASLTKWSYLMISLPGARDSFDQQSLGAVMNEFYQTLGKIGVSAAKPLSGQRIELRHPDDPALGSTLQHAAGALDLLFIVLPGANIPLYKRIKTIADRNCGIHTICSVGSKLSKDRGRDQYMANVALKFNLKLGGINQMVEKRNLGIIDQDKTMVVGIDVTHPSPSSSSNAPSVSAMVASIDKFLAGSALKACIALHDAIRSFRSQDRDARALKAEVNDLSVVLGFLLETMANNPTIDFKGLELPLERCGTVCRDYTEIVKRCTKHSNGSKSSKRDWIAQKYLQGDINDFRIMLATYKSTINIALANANLCIAAIPPDVLENYKDMICDTTIDLDNYLRDVQEKIDRLQAGDAAVVEDIAGECQAMLEEKKSAQQGLEMCNRLSSQITQFESASKEHERFSDRPSVHKHVKSGLGEVKGSVKSLVTRLQTHAALIDKQLEAVSSTDAGPETTAAQLARLQQIKESIGNCIEVVSDANKTADERSNVFEDIRLADNSYAITVSTVNELVMARGLDLKDRSRYLGGQVTDKTVQESIAALTKLDSQNLVSLQQKHQDRGQVLSQADAIKVGKVPKDTQPFVDRFGPGVSLSYSKIS